MSEKIKLLVKEIPTNKVEIKNNDGKTKETVEKIESVSIGNYTIEFKKGKTIETDSRDFADLLIREYGLVEAVPKKRTPRRPRPKNKQKQTNPTNNNLNNEMDGGNK